jgi:hypothetical protein
MALAQPADAKIVYTLAHHVIQRIGTYSLDLNHGHRGLQGGVALYVPG